MIFRLPDDLSEAQIEEFRTIYENLYGEKLSKADAKEIGLNVIRFIALVYNKDEN